MTSLAGQSKAGGEAVWHDIECGAYTADLPLWHELAAAAASDDGACDLLELGCGTGRVALELAGPSCNVTALDSDEELVRELRSRAKRLDLPVRAVTGDARAFDLGRGFDVVLAPMQLVQLIHDSGERLQLLRSVARHLRPGARFAFALLELEQEWSAAPADAPLADMREIDGWVYSSRPVAVRRARREQVIELDRVRDAVSPDGSLERSFSRVRLMLVSARRLEQEGRRAGLVVERRRRIEPTEEHVGSTVVVLRADG